MRAFEYANPQTLDEAVSLLVRGAVPLAGGTDLLSLMKDDIVRPTRLVNLKSIAELGGIEAREGGLRVGATVRLDELAAVEEVGRRFPALLQAVDGIRSPQLRNMGTVGGELLQRPRCWYFRSGFGLLAQHESGSRVEDGDNRYHAILGTSGPAWFVHPSSLAPAMIALGAQARIYGPRGERRMPLSELFRVPRAEGERENTLADDEVLCDLWIPDAMPTNACYEVRQKQALDWPLASAAVVVDLDGDRVRTASVVLGHVAPTPYVAGEAAAALSGRPIDETSALRVGEAAVAGARALSRNAYKIQLAKVAVKRALLRAAGREVA